MKTLNLRHASAFALLLLAAGTRAAAPAEPATLFAASNSAAMERAVHHQMNRFVIFPLAQDTDHLLGTVDVGFVVNTEGHVVVVSTASENEELCAYVVAKLKRIQVGPNPSGLWKTSHVRFTFRAE